MDKDKIRKEIYWLFRDAIHNGHRQIKFENGKVTAYKAEEEKTQHICYVCHILKNVEREIAKLFGDEYYTDTLPKEKNGKTKLY